MATDTDEIIIKISRKHLVGIFLIFILSFFVVVSYVSALTSYQPSIVSQYTPSKPSPPPLPTFAVPVAKAGPNQDVFLYGVVFFDGSGSTDQDGEIKSYSWNFGDGTNASGVIVTHKYYSEGVFTVTLTVKDNLRLVDTDTLKITVSMPTFEEISSLPIEDLTTVLELLPPDDSMETLMNLNSSLAADIFEALNVSVALNVVDAAILANYTTDMSVILLRAEGEYSAEVIIGVDTELGVELIESMIEINSTGCAHVVEFSVFIDLNSSVTFFEVLDDEILAELFLEIARLPSTPLTVATIFESLSIEKTHAVSKEWISLGELQMLEEVFVLLEQETLNGIFDLLSVTERVAIYPYLSTSTLFFIRRELLPIPELEFTPITVSRLGSRGYNVSVAVHNRGNVEADNIFGEFWVEGDLASPFEIPDLSADSSTEVSFMWKPPSKGVYTLEVILDPENVIEEIDETNNEILTTYGVELPELQVAFETVPTEFVKGKSYVIEIAVSNTGEQKADNFDLVLEASGIIVEQGTVRWISFTIGSSQVDSLPVGTSRVFDFSWEPENEGAYTFSAKVDTQEQILEGNRANNDVTFQIEVEARPPLWPYLFISMAIMVAVVGVLVLVRPQTFDFLRRFFSEGIMKKNYYTYRALFNLHVYQRTYS